MAGDGKDGTEEIIVMMVGMAQSQQRIIGVAKRTP